MLRFGLPIILVVVVGCFFGFYDQIRGRWPIQQLRSNFKHAGVHDSYGRLVSYPGKVEVSCPRQTPETAVILAIGQSNIANHAAKRIVAAHGGAVLNAFGGKCYLASSPLLGATGDGGEFLTLLADRLIADGLYRGVVIVASGIGGSEIARWRQNGDLNDMLRDALKALPPDYKITEVIWHQGEADFGESTSPSDYAASFESLVQTLRASGVEAPIYASIATRCGNPWAPDNPTARAQRALIDDKRILLGVDSDALLVQGDRDNDCHFSASGQRKVADAFAEAIERSHRAH